MKKIILFLSAGLLLNSAFAESGPVIGLWEKSSVLEQGQNLVARTNYIFTNQKITGKTIFSAFQDTDPFVVVCCLEVKNIKPVKLGEILEKYKMDPEFVKHMRGIKGANFIYEAIPVKQSEWNKFMKKVMSQDSKPTDFSPYYAPLIAAKLKGDKFDRLELGKDKIDIKIRYPKSNNKIIYEFVVNGKKTIISEDAFAD